MRDSASQNLPCTLTRADLDACDPRPSGGRIRARCPLHGSDHQRSLSVDQETGHWRCFSCGRWGYVTDWTAVGGAGRSASPRRPQPSAPKAPPPPIPQAMHSRLLRCQQALLAAPEDHPAVVYLIGRGIPREVAAANGWGCCLGREWPGTRDELLPWRAPGVWLLIAPTRAPVEWAWRAVNVYARVAVPGMEPRHDFLPGGKGFLPARPAVSTGDAVVLVEGPMDALACAASGHRALALLGASPVNVPWPSLPPGTIVAATDADAAGRGGAVQLVVAAMRHGRQAVAVPREWFCGAKDVAEVLARDGSLPPLPTVEPEAAPPAPVPPPTAPPDLPRHRVTQRLGRVSCASSLPAGWRRRLRRRR